MAKIFISYAWADNTDFQVDFVAQELQKAGATVIQDKWDFGSGKRLWEQIDGFIRDAKKSDAWLMYATQNSLGSEPCKEEFAYALNRALKSAGSAFPILALFPASVDESLIPAGIETRLFVSLTDPHWKERIIAGAEGRTPSIRRPKIDPFAYKVHHLGAEIAVELRPRAGTWSPFVVGVLANERAHVQPRIASGASGRPPNAAIVIGMQEGLSEDGLWWLTSAASEATPTHSYYLYCANPPSRIMFGQLDSKHVHELTFSGWEPIPR